MERAVKIERQAIVLIHGMGEQRPMDTITGFVKNIAPKVPNSKSPAFYSKPDPFSETFELRRFSAHKHAKSHKTDYYEFYWANLLQGTQLLDVLWWIWQLMFRWPHQVPKRLVGIFCSAWLFFIVIMGTTILYSQYSADHQSIWLKVVTYVVGIVWFVINGILINYLGDVVRYVTPRPRNINERQKIRQAGINLLRKLHEKGEDGKPTYDRIVIVGHSLGSVIAYDLISLFWIEKHQGLKGINDPDLDTGQTPLDIAEAATTAFWKIHSPSPEQVQQYRQSQFELWKSQYNQPNAWLISDFISLGSPLAYLDLLISANPEDFRERIDHRHFPTCPPKMETPSDTVLARLGDPTKTQWLSYPPSNLGQPRTLHHAAPFAMTRWTNFYFKNDYVGGPVDSLGAGIEEVELTSATHGHIPFLSHRQYWSEREKESLQKLLNSIQLRL